MGILECVFFQDTVDFFPHNCCLFIRGPLNVECWHVERQRKRGGGWGVGGMLFVIATIFRKSVSVKF